MKLTHWLKTLFLIFMLSFFGCQSPSSSNQVAQFSGLKDNGSGIGGTGLIEDGDSGIGGTGIVGVITGFGSIWVNGVRVEVDVQTQVLTPWGEMPVQDLAVGHQVVLQTEAHSNRPLQNQLQLIMPLNGQIEQLNHEQGYFTLLGQRVWLSAETQLATEVKPGQNVTVSGFYQADKNWIATRVEPARDARARLQVELPLMEWAETTQRLIIQRVGEQTALPDERNKVDQPFATLSKATPEVQMRYFQREQHTWRLVEQQRMSGWLNAWPDTMRRPLPLHKPIDFELWQQQRRQQHRPTKPDLKPMSPQQGAPRGMSAH